MDETSIDIIANERPSDFVERVLAAGDADLANAYHHYAASDYGVFNIRRSQMHSLQPQSPRPSIIPSTSARWRSNSSTCWPTSSATTATSLRSSCASARIEHRSTCRNRNLPVSDTALCDSPLSPTCDTFRSMKTRLAIASLGTISILATLGFGTTVTASAPSQSAEDAAEAAWETHVASSTPDALPGTLSCAVSDDAGAHCCLLRPRRRRRRCCTFSVVARSTSTDGAVLVRVRISHRRRCLHYCTSRGEPSGGRVRDARRVGMDLQSAQDLLQDTAGNFLYYSSRRTPPARAACS